MEQPPQNQRKLTASDVLLTLGWDIVAFLTTLALYAGFFFVCWNLAVPQVFGVPYITYFQSYALLGCLSVLMVLVRR